MVLETIQVQGPSGFPFLDILCFISNNNSRSRHARVKHSINRLFLSTRGTSLKLTYLIYLLWFSREFKYKVPAGFHSSTFFVISATITRDPGMLEWNTLLLDYSSQRGEHFWNWHIWSISNGSRNNSSTRSQRVSIPRHLFVLSATITRDPGMLDWNTL